MPAPLDDPGTKVAHPAEPGSTPASEASPPADYDFNQGWLFGGRYTSGMAAPGYDDSGFAPVTLPHAVTPLGWGDWDHRSWEHVWIYRKHFDAGSLPGGRVFADFDGVMTDATVLLNGTAVATHQGGYLPFSAELTRHLRPGRNVLAVIVDSRWLPVPPDGAPGGARAVDFLQPGGIYRDVRLRVVPETFLADVFARPVAVLTPGRSLEITATIDTAAVPPGPVQLTATLLDGGRPVAARSATVAITAAGTATARLTLTGLGGITLWSPQHPKLYTTRVTLAAPGRPPHTLTVRTGFRKAVFRAAGFYLNGQRLQIFGLNRHQLFPYTGMTAAARLQRRDAEILRTELNCTMVRCSHYPQSPHFLDACDELGLMVWQEAPGWHYLGNAAWRRLVVRNVHDMIIRDRNRPSVIVWGTRLNETAAARSLYATTRRLARELDGTRQTTGAMDRHSTFGWAEDVFAFNDYQRARRGKAALRPPLRGVPYLVSEAVGAIDGSPAYRWTDPGPVLAAQAALHGEVHSIAALNPRYAGLLGWCGIDYASLTGGKRIWRNLKTPGVLDTFRVPKPGAAIYASQVDPAVRPVILPVFWWGGEPGGPGRAAMVATNCDRLEIYAGGQQLATGTPDTGRFAGLRYPPVIVDLTGAGPGALPDLRIDGYTGGTLAASVQMSADPARDRLVLTADHARLAADGSDATRVTFRAVDAYGNQRPRPGGSVVLALAGPAELIGDSPFPFGSYGGAGGAFVRSRAGETGPVSVTARHPVLGTAAVQLLVEPPAPGRLFR